ncbi:MAG: acyl carrier protein [Erysipelotrichaceae bacterium]|nr:acyl carrier protein [Erysipelotrichaceae bacterium]
MSQTKMEQFREMFAERLGVKNVDESKSLRDLGLDSLDVVEMCLDLEDRFGVSFETEELSSFKTVSDLFRSVEAKLNE